MTPERRRAESSPRVTKKKGDTKRQHYVPQFILRKFSGDDRNTSILRLADGLVVESGPLKRQCYEDYFYGEDQIMEKSFAESESKISNLLGDLGSDCLEALSEDDLFQLKNFVHYQTHRTRAAVEQQAEFVGSFVKQTTLTTRKLNGEEVDAEALSRVRLVNPNGVSDAIWQAARTTPSLHDLEVKFLVSEHALGFVIADHPVAYCNQFAEHHKVLQRWRCATGALSKGLQIFLPLSSSVTLMLYDPDTYAFDAKGRVCRVGPRDVLFLNKVQGVNALRCVFFDSSRTSLTSRGRPKAGFNLPTELVSCRRTHPNVHRPEVHASEVYKRGGQMGQLVAVVRHDIRVGATYSFLRVTDKSSYVGYDGAHVPTRSERQVELAEDYAQMMDLVEKEYRKNPENGGRIEDERLLQLAESAGRRRRRRRVYEAYRIYNGRDGPPSGIALSQSEISRTD